MQYLLDTANLDEIKKAFDLYPMDGITTNPSIISKEDTEFFEHMKQIRDIIGPKAMIHAQVLSEDAETMIEEAIKLNEKIGGNFYVKIPVTAQGIKAIKAIVKLDIKVTATAIFTAQQALMAAKAGASYVAPYVDRSDNITGNGVGVIAEIITLFNNFDIKTKVLAASFANVQQVHNSMLKGSHSVTVNMRIMDRLLYHPLTDWSVRKFIVDWEGTYGENNNILSEH